MKSATAGGAAVAVLVAAAVAIAAVLALVAWCGRTIDGRIERAVAEWTSRPAFVRDVRHEVARGFFRSTHRLTLDLGCIGPSATETPVAVTVTASVRHGPFAGSTLALAEARTEIGLGGAAGERLRSAFAGRSPLALRTVVAFDGGARTEATSPAAAFSLGDGLDIGWLGVSGTLDTRAEPRRAAFRLRGDGFTAAVPERLALRVGALELRGESTPQVHTAGLDLAFVDATSPPLAPPGGVSTTSAASGVRLTGRIEPKGELVDASTAFEGGARVGASGAYRFEARSTVQRLHGATVRQALDRMAAALLRCRGDAADPVARAPAEATAALWSLAKHDPSLAFEETATDAAGRRLDVSGSIALRGMAGVATAEDLRAIAEHVEARLVLRVPLAWIRDQIDDRAAFDAALAQSVAQGFVVLDGDVATSRIEVTKGVFAVNGKPLATEGLAMPDLSPPR